MIFTQTSRSKKINSAERIASPLSEQTRFLLSGDYWGYLCYPSLTHSYQYILSHWTRQVNLTLRFHFLHEPWWCFTHDINCVVLVGYKLYSFNEKMISDVVLSPSIVLDQTCMMNMFSLEVGPMYGKWEGKKFEKSFRARFSRLRKPMGDSERKEPVLSRVIHSNDQGNANTYQQADNFDCKTLFYKKEKESIRHRSLSRWSVAFWSRVSS